MNEYRPTEYVVDFGDYRSNRFVELSMALIEKNGAKLHERIVRCRDCKWFTSENWYEEERGFGLTEFVCEPPDCGNPQRCATTYDRFKEEFVPIHVTTEPDGFCAWGERREQ